MKNQPIRVLIGFALLASIGIFIVQGYWFGQAFKSKRAEFEFQVFLSLKEIASELADYNGIMLPSANPVQQVSSNYFVVMINDAIDPSVLEALLLRGFKKMGLEADFQYGIYDCLTDQMVYSNRLNAFSEISNEDQQVKEPEFENDNYYFSVYFPGITSILVGSMGIWLFSSVILLVVIGFFSWSAIIILKQRRLSEIHSDFVNNLTHEMKTPLASMSLAAERLDQRIADDDRSMKILQEELINLEGKISKILESVKSEKWDENLTLNQVDFSALINDLQIESKYPTEEISVLIESDLKALGHEGAIKSIMGILLENALIHGKPPIQIRLYRIGKRVILEVKDHGEGIPRVHQNKVFDKFYRIPKGNLYSKKGFGLGLFHLSQLARKQKAKVSIDCPEEGGCIFRVSFKSA